ncbi:hypothetical protein LCGC14_1727250 [marine sediment metagenome]|uniref:Uncharacterized protein n=1 Tax=marine sediment metagenome TaxID=412755 RepID=A0A0F9HAE9_9ZZZZ
MTTGNEVGTTKLEAKGWMFVTTYGFTSVILARGDDRILVDKKTGEIQQEYNICQSR